MALYESLVRPMAFCVDPERVHNMAMRLLERGYFQARSVANPRLSQTLFGVTFPNPLGLAAGFDKNADAVDYWHQLGFGHVEVGTVTYHAQPGNEKPRLFRIPEEKALINRMGFNNDGARAVATRIATAKSRIPLGINLGKSKITELPNAAEDYQSSFRLLRPFGQYFVVNVSSPNTPGLRSLQEKGPLKEIFQALKELDAEKPLFVKVAPDLSTSSLDDVLEVASDAKLTGIIATNTTISREMLRRPTVEAGGLSGAPVKEIANEALSHIGRHAPKEMVIIGVGGIFTGDDVFEKIRLGAHICQTYTGWVYGGPQMVPQCLERLGVLLDQSGMTLDELRGSAHR